LIPQCFQKLHELEVLLLNNNKITALENLENLAKLKRFEIRGNRLTALGGIKGLVNLEYLTVSCNSIGKVEYSDLADEYPKLTELGLFGNYLGDNDDLGASKKLFEELIDILSEKVKELKVIYIGGNYFTLLGEYVREYIVGKFKYITRIDGDNI
jgi:Leucine-rich repeat (LRR) protein